MPTSVAIYARISDDRDGQGLGVARQERLCRDLAGRKAWPVAAVFVDNSISATSGKKRPGYEKMLDALRDGTHDGLLCVDVDRLTRTPSELEILITLCDAHGVAMANVSGDFDLATSDGRLRARLLGAVARAEVEKKSERQKRANEDLAQRGRFVSHRRVFGWKKGTLEQEPIEAGMIRDAVARVLAGEPMASIAREWNAHGHETTDDNPWSVQTVRTTLGNPRHAGLQYYKGDHVGDGQWSPIISRAEHEQLTAQSRRRRQSGPPRTYLLSGFLRCGHCGGPMVGGPNNGKPSYICPAPCLKTNVKAEPVDALITDQVLTALDTVQIPVTDANGHDLTATLVKDEQLLEELAQDRADGVMTRSEWLAAREIVGKRIEKTTRDLNKQSAPKVPADPRTWWGTATVAQKRALIGVLIESIAVGKHSGPRNKFDANRFKVTLTDVSS